MAPCPLPPIQALTPEQVSVMACVTCICRTAKKRTRAAGRTCFPGLRYPSCDMHHHRLLWGLRMKSRIHLSFNLVLRRAGIVPYLTPLPFSDIVEATRSEKLVQTVLVNSRYRRRTEILRFQLIAYGYVCWCVEVKNESDKVWKSLQGGRDGTPWSFSLTIVE